MFGRFKKTENNTNIEYIIAGLGNPGREYEITRHNAGFMAMDYISNKCEAKIDRIKFKSLCTDTKIAGKRVLLLKPQTFMNSSGQAILEAAAFYKVPMDRVIIIYDDISLAVGKMRVRSKGSDGGHNGVKNIIYLSGTDVFPRIKIGVGQKPHPDYDLVSWVLSKFSENDLKELSDIHPKVLGAVESIVSGNINEAMNKFN